MTNKSLAHYELVEKIGEGGMGEVFRARDTKLGRDVALKFLPDALAADAERLSRFEREARLLASLNHPHIASIHGFEQVGGQRFLVLEMVEGEDLSKRIATGPIPVEEALPIARQIAEALEAAHDDGIIHRDLKPGNVVVTPQGSVKVLDFGLAKAWESDAPSSNLSHSPTVLTNSPTVAGVILGTAAYMSPEQARGRTVDRRADIFAFGCVLFEMLTGRQAFAGDTVSDTLAAVLRAEPEWGALPPDTPRAITKLLRRCLDKDAKQRLRDVGEARIVIERVLAGHDDPEAAVAAAPAAKSRSGVLPWALAVVFAIVAAAVGAAYLMTPTQEARVLRTSILPPENVRFNLRGIHPGPVAMSPDGNHVVFTGRRSGGTSVLFVRELDATEARPLPGTDGAGYPFWSPDGRSIGFFADGKLKRVDITGGPPLTLCEAPVGKGGSWGRDGTIVFAPSFNTPLHIVSENGGESTPVTEVIQSRGDNSHRFPWLLPDGDHFLYFARGGGEGSAIRAGSISSDEDKEIMRSTSNAMYAPGYLLFLRESTLMARPFDPDKLEFAGDPVPVGDPVRFIPGAMCGIFSASQDGMLVYQGGASVPGAKIVWRDLDGEEVDSFDDVVQQDGLAVSPDGTQICAAVFDNVGGTADIWIYDVARRIRTRFTFDPANDLSPIWSPDGRRVVFASNRNGTSSLYVKNFGGASNEEPLLELDANLYPSDWTRDGKYLVFNRIDSTSTGDVWALPMGGSGDEPIPVADSPHGEYDGRVSPNCRWIAYDSDESGQFEVYVTSFPEPGRKWQISSGGGDTPEWSPDGKAIYYSGNNTFFAVETDPGESTFGIGATKTLFESNTEISYRADPAGGRLILIEDADEGGVSPLTLVTGWVDDAKSRER
jgi:Tol biopolymer transport system component